ncbi:MAG: preprotein translocase subunit YajC [Desulfovibrio sp.]|jgi:preprotein translocase subunit YajC|nr:preprotein translocase subunit YajC [Desulfovibrio sp.]
MLSSIAYAMGPSPSGGGGGDAFTSFVPLILMFAVFYFLLIRPQQKRAKELKNMLASLKPGDEVLTSGGIYGRILETAENHVILDTGEVELKISRAAVTSVVAQARVEPIRKSKKGAESKGKNARKPVREAERTVESDSEDARPDKDADPAPEVEAPKAETDGEIQPEADETSNAPEDGKEK